MAEAVKAHKITISKLERGEMALTQKWMSRLSDALQVNSADLLTDPPLVRSVYINGAISDDFNLLKTTIMGDQKELEPIQFSVDYGVREPKKSLFFFMGTEMFAPGLREGDIVRFTSLLDEEGPEKFIGRICIFENDKPRSVLVGIPEYSKDQDKYDLRMPTGARMQSLMPDRVYVLSMVLGLGTDFVVDENGFPI